MFEKQGQFSTYNVQRMPRCLWPAEPDNPENTYNVDAVYKMKGQFSSIGQPMGLQRMEEDTHKKREQVSVDMEEYVPSPKKYGGVKAPPISSVSKLESLSEGYS